MKTLIKNARLLPSDGGDEKKLYNIVVENEFIKSISEKTPDGAFDETIDARGGLAASGLYNAHCHAAMTLFRGFGEDLPLDRWLTEKIYPAEDKLTNESVYLASKLAIAEMLKNGIVSFTDMYFFCPDTVRAVAETGIKSNIARCIVNFDPKTDFDKDYRMNEGKDLFREYHNSSDGRVKIDMSLHAEYTNNRQSCRYIADFAKENNLMIQIHMSETEKEHLACIEKYRMTPAEFMCECGVFDVPVTAAHCVYVSDSDIILMKQHGVTAVHNPVSNLKLGSGVMPLRKLLDAGVNVALGTDGVASNNNLDLLYEMRVAAILHKGVSRNPEETHANEMWRLATKNGAISQGRNDCGNISVGNRADIIIIDLDAVNNLPSYDIYNTLAYSATSANIKMTMADGRVLYRDGEYTTIDIEKLKNDFSEMLKHYFD